MGNLQIRNGKIITDTQGIVTNDFQNIATGTDSHAEGTITTATGTSSHAEGDSTTASNTSSHAEGSGTIASGTYSHAEGLNTTANASAAHSEGRLTTASGNYSHAGGDTTIAAGQSSFNHSIGSSTVQSLGSAILGGSSNNILNVSSNLSSSSAILGGSNNTITASSGNALQSVILGGSINEINTATNSVIIGGNNHTINASANRSVIIGGQLLTLNESDTILLGGIKRGGYVLSNTLTSNVNSSSTTPALITGWQFTAIAGAIYELSVIGNYQTAATTTGGRLKIGGTATCTVVGRMYGAVSSTAVATELAFPATSMTSQLITTGVSAINTPHHIGMDVIFNCSVGGTIQIEWGSEVAGSNATLLPGSTIIVERIN